MDLTARNRARVWTWILAHVAASYLWPFVLWIVDVVSGHRFDAGVEDGMSIILFAALPVWAPAYLLIALGAYIFAIERPTLGMVVVFWGCYLLLFVLSFLVVRRLLAPRGLRGDTP